MLCNIILYGPFLLEKPIGLFHNKTFRHHTFFFSQFVLCRASDNTISKYWEDGCMSRPPPQIFGRTVPSVPLSLRPWLGWGMPLTVCIYRIVSSKPVLDNQYIIKERIDLTHLPRNFCASILEETQEELLD